MRRAPQVHRNAVAALGEIEFNEETAGVEPLAKVRGWRDQRDDRWIG